jgi:hypothetical protein
MAKEVELEIVQLKYPYHDSSIFAQLLGFKAKKITYGKIKNQIIKKIPVYSDYDYSHRAMAIASIREVTKTEGEVGTRLSSKEDGTESKSSLGPYYTRSGLKLNKKSVLSSFKFGVGLVGDDGRVILSPEGGRSALTKKKAVAAKLLGSVAYPSSNSNNIGITKLMKLKNKSESKLASLNSSSVNKFFIRVDHKGTINLNLRKINKNKQIASVLMGIKVRIAGRLARQRVVPKRTVKTLYKGAISKSNSNFVDSATYTGKNKKGAFSIRVWLSHGINKPKIVNLV